MASLNSLNRNVLRLTGLSSGMDTSSMVESLLKIDQMKVDKQFKMKTQLEWKGDSYRDFNLKIRSFREKFMSVLNPATNIFSGSAFNAFTVNMTDPDMSKYVSVTAGSNAQQGAMTIRSIDRLATAAKAVSSDMWKTGTSEVVSLDTKLGDAKFKNDIDWQHTPYDNPAIAEAKGKGWTVLQSNDAYFSQPGNTYDPAKTYLVNPDDQNDVVAHETYQNPAIYEAKANDWEELTGQELIDAVGTPDAGKRYFINPGKTEPNNIEAYDEVTYDVYATFKVNDTEFRITKDTTLNEMITMVNAKSGETGVTMSYSSLTKGFSFTSRETGAESKVDLQNVKGKVFGSSDSDLGAFGIKAGAVYGENAQVTFYDAGTAQTITVEKNSNNFSMDGIQYSLKQKYINSDPAKDITFQVERDIEPVFQKIKGFIEGYNALLEELNNAYTKRPNKEYGPLTESEKSQLSEKEAEQWEGFAKEGLLYRDSNISMLLSTMRGAFYEKVAGTGKTNDPDTDRTASDIGLRTTPYDYSSGGKITIDEDALRAALASNPEQVKDIFTKVSDSTDSSTKYKESGLVVRISDALNSYVKNVTEISLASNSRQLNAAQDKLEQMERWLLDRENRYWKQFSAMEAAMASLQSQSSWIGNMMGGGQ